ncbi:MAG TPA: hypothetical protein VGK20_13365 [Candidatus Binatia bacterium]|jgi:hypothetical protein
MTIRRPNRTFRIASLLFLLVAANAPALAAPVAGHPRLWLTAGDLPKLRSWAVPGNAVYQQGLQSLVATSVSNYNTKYFPGGVAKSPYPDFGDTQGYTGLLSEEDGLILAFQSLVDPNASNRQTYAKMARDLLMYVMDQASLGHQSGVPFRDPSFAVYNRANNTGPNWGLIVDWIYDATDSMGQPILSSADKLEIRNVFMAWANDCVNASTTGGDHPSPIGAQNSTTLLPGNRAYRMAANNYYLGHARLMILAALSLDASDDPPIDNTKSVNQLGNSLRSYLADATGAWLYQEFAMFGDPSAVQAAFSLPSSQGLGLASGGLPSEGMLYGHSIGFLLAQLLALQTAGYNDVAVTGPQAGLIGAPVWDRFVRGFYHSIVPAAQVPPSEAYLGPVYQMTNYGDILRLWMTPDFMQPMALLALLEQQTGDLSRQNAEKWWVINVVEGGAGNLMHRIQNPWNRVEAILYFMLLDPTAASPVDPRPQWPTTFYDAPAGRLLARTDWSASASMFDFRCSWISINHQDGDAGLFEMYRSGEWLTKEASNYDNSGNGQTSLYHNTVTLKNTCQNGTPANLQWYEAPFWNNGSQWILGSSQGDPVAATSSGSGYSFASCNDTGLYNRPSMWTPANAAQDITHSSRSILWLQPDHVVVYDRATSQSSGLFKRFNLSLVAQPTEAGNVLTETTGSGQHLFVTSLLPAGATIATSPIPNIGLAELEPSRYQVRIEDPSDPSDVRFLHVLQGADAGSSADPASLVQSTSGTAFDGVVVHGTAALFLRDSSAMFAGTTYVVPSSTVQHYISGLSPGTGYAVATQTVGSALQVTVSPDGTDAYADSAGVLVWPQSPIPPPPPPSCASSISRPSLKMSSTPFLMKLSGQALIPLPWTAVNPPANGIHVTIDDAVGSGGGIDAALPGGAFDGTSGWKTNSRGTKWLYVDPAGSVAGITKAAVRDMSSQVAGMLRWSIVGRGAGPIALPDVNTAQAEVTLGATDECATVAFGAPGAAPPRCVSVAGRMLCR